MDSWYGSGCLLGVASLRQGLTVWCAWRERCAEMTASEPLTIEEEYEMQQSWLEDPTKCTFIVLDRTRATDDSPDGGP